MVSHINIIGFLRMSLQINQSVIQVIYIVDKLKENLYILYKQSIETFMVKYDFK